MLPTKVKNREYPNLETKKIKLADKEIAPKINSDVANNNLIDEVKIEEEIIEIDALDDEIKAVESMFTLSDLDYINAESNVHSKNGIALRQDLFPTTTGAYLENAPTSQNVCFAIPIVLHGIQPKKSIVPKLLWTNPETLTVDNPKLKVTSITPVEDGAAVTPNFLTNPTHVLGLTKDPEISTVASTAKCKIETIKLKKVCHKEVPAAVKEAQSLIKSNLKLAATPIIHERKGEVVSRAYIKNPHNIHNSTKKTNPVQSTRSLTVASKVQPVLPKGCIINSKMGNDTVILNEVIFKDPPHLGKEVNKAKNNLNLISEVAHTPNKTICNNKIQSESKQNGLEKVGTKSDKAPIVLKKLDLSEVPQEIKKAKSLLNIKPVHKVHRKSLAPIFFDSYPTGTPNTLVPEIRLSSLVHSSHVPTVSPNCDLLSTSVAKPNTNLSSAANSTKVHGNEGPLSGFHWVDLQNDLSDNEEGCAEDLGLTSIEELQELWELVVELHVYNNQVIKSLQDKKRRFQSRVRKLEIRLTKQFGIMIDDAEDQCNQETQPAEKDGLSLKMENTVMETNNDGPKEE